MRRRSRFGVGRGRAFRKMMYHRLRGRHYHIRHSRKRR